MSDHGHVRVDDGICAACGAPGMRPDWGDTQWTWGAAVDRPDNGHDERSWRVGEHYRIHVYRGDEPVATFHRPEDAARAAAAVNTRAAALSTAELEVELTGRGWLVQPMSTRARAGGQQGVIGRVAAKVQSLICGDGSALDGDLEDIADELLALLTPHTDEETR